MQVAARCVCSSTSTLMLVAFLSIYLVSIASATSTSSSPSTVYSTTHLNEPNDLYCSPGLYSKGFTRPRGDIVLEYGNPLEIFCILNPAKTDRNSSSLIFYHNTDLIPSKYLEIINETTLRLYIEKPAPSKSYYYCKLKADNEDPYDKDEAVCLNSVAVGFKPEPVHNFSCISMNWENLTCMWTPALNYVKTVHKLVYSLPGRAGGRFFYTCPDNMDERLNMCFWDRTTSTLYRQPYDYYYFKMTIENAFGSIHQKIRFHHYAYVVPSKPVNLTYVSKTPHSVVIQWSVGFPMQNFPIGVVQKVEYKSQWDDPHAAWQVVDTSHLNIKSSFRVLNITGLKYAHSRYDIRVSMKSPAAMGNDKWSKPATVTIKTLSTVPAAPPQTDIGSFELNRGLPPEMKKARDIYVYWQYIPERIYNGDSFEYRVMNVDENGEETHISPNEMTKAYARFQSFGLKEYHLRIYSHNQEGYSKNGSDIFIPSIYDSVPEPLTFTKISFEKGIYELSWKQPENNSRIESYTIFWCENNKDRPHQCKGYLNWTHVPGDTFIRNVTFPNEDQVYQFAISANTKSESSGMVWASCTVIHNKPLGKMKSVWISNIGSTFIELGWKLECSDRVSVVRGYRIYYCPLASPGTKECKGEKYNITVMGDPPMTAHGNVTGLKPYTTYILAIAVLTKSEEGLHSDTLFNTTLEDAPSSPPQNVRVADVTNTSMMISWDPPPSMNGVLRKYLVFINNSEPQILNPDTKILQMNDLFSYHTYNISVVACTVACSPHSIPVLVKTLAGSPGLLEQPVTSFVNKTEVAVYWSPPVYPGGPLSYYQLKVTKSNDNTNSSDSYDVNGNGTVVEMQCDVEGETLIYSFAVRAINVREEDNTTFYGPWSLPGERSCYNTGLPKSIVVIIWVFSVFAVVALFFGFLYVARWMWLCCKHMMDVKVKLPPGLDPPIQNDDDDREGEIHKRMHGFLPENGMNLEHEFKSGPPPDQELLLLNKADCDGDGDSSGCSSAHESVSSSLTSGTHISDSGTEADQRADSPDGVFGDSSSPGPSIRQRNVSNHEGARSIDPYVVMGSDSSPDPTEIGYCRVGNAERAATTSGYVGLPLPLNSPGYVSHPPLWSDTSKESTPPTSPAAGPTPKGYVMAGALPQPQSSMSYCRLGWEKQTRSPSDYVTLPTSSKNSSEL